MLPCVYFSSPSERVQHKHLMSLSRTGFIVRLQILTHHWTNTCGTYGEEPKQVFGEEFYSSYKSFYQEGVCTVTLKVSKLFDDHKMCWIAILCHFLCKSSLCVTFSVSTADQSVNRSVWARDTSNQAHGQCWCSPGSRVGRLITTSVMWVVLFSLLPLHPDWIQCGVSGSHLRYPVAVHTSDAKRIGVTLKHIF